MIMRKLFFRKKNFGKFFPWKFLWMTLFLVVVWLTDDRKYSLYFGENHIYTDMIWITKFIIYKHCFFLKKVFPQTTILKYNIVSGGTEDWCWKTKTTFKVFFVSLKKDIKWFGKNYQREYTGKMMKNVFFRKKTFQGNSYWWKCFWMTLLSVGIQRIDDMEEKFHFRDFFCRKSFFQEKFCLVFYELSLGLHTTDDGSKKNFFEMIFLNKVFF